MSTLRSHQRHRICPDQRYKQREVRAARSTLFLAAASKAAKATIIFLLAIASATAPAQAAVQGSIGATDSTGSVDIDFVLGLRARISGLNDLTLGTWSGSGSLTGNDNLCIGTLGTNSPYRIRASGDGTPGDPSAFTLSNGADTIAYNAWFNDAPNAGGGRQPLTGGLTLNGQTSSNFVRFFNIFGCVFQNANISIEVPEAELAGATGSYTGTLTLLLLPE